MNRFLLIFVIFLCCNFSYAQNIVNDEIAQNLSKSQEQPKTYLNYNFESTIKLPVKLKIMEQINSEAELFEGQIINFKVLNDVIYNDKIIIERGSLVSTTVSTIITPGMNGIPASIILKDFSIEYLKKGRLTNYYEIFGQDRSIFVFPLKWALTPLPPTGSLTNFICGGHAKIKPKKIITIYYYPEWK